MSRRPGSRPHGQIRQSQLITSFGPGSMVDLPNHSVDERHFSARSKPKSARSRGNRLGLHWRS
jgi:hypothetical protein